MDYLAHNIAVNLSRCRKAHGWSLDVTSEQTGVSKSMLAQIERGAANPSIGTLGKISSGLRISFDQLISPPPMDTILVDVEQTAPIKSEPGSYRVWNCFPYEDNQIIEIYRIDLAPGGVYHSGSHGERTREYISVTSGEISVSIEEKEYHVGESCCFRFESDRPHDYRGCGDGTSSMLVFFVSY